MPFFALANQGLKALGALAVFFGIAAAVAIVTLINIILACRNISRKSKGMRIANIILLLPVLGISLAMMTSIPAFSMVGFAVTFITGIIIYDSLHHSKTE
jgi:hypothetical protein